MEELNRLLKKQIVKKFGPVEQLPKEMEELIEAISQSYDRYDRDLELIERTMDLSSQELSDANQKMALQTRQLETRNKELEQFAYIASHDLQEPLRTMTSLVDLLTNGYQDKIDSSGQRMIKYINEAASRMSYLIKGLLDYSRIGRESTLTTINLNHLLTEIKTDLTSAIIKSGAAIEIEPMPTLQGFELELRLLFQNLLSNALKFTKPNVPPVIYVTAKEQATGGWQFSVTDNGIGIDDEFKEKIFIIFQRLHNKGQYEGNGIGLAHCMKIAELHKGRIWVESKPGEGSTFHFTINT